MHPENVDPEEMKDENAPGAPQAEATQDENPYESVIHGMVVSGKALPAGLLALRRKVLYVWEQAWQPQGDNERLLVSIMAVANIHRTRALDAIDAALGQRERVVEEKWHDKHRKRIAYWL